MAFERVLQAIEDMKNGKMIVMVDDEDRENEGDIVFAADCSDMAKVNFAITYARGVLCLAMDEANAKRLDLPLMVPKNTSSHETAFTVTIDAKSVATGVSAYERDISMRLAADANSTPDDFVRPGHIFPLIAKNGGVLVRTGHTEGSVDLCRLAGLTPMAAICEVVKDDGSMARRDDLEKFCATHGLNMISVSELVEYRLSHESLIKVSEPIKSDILHKSALRYDIIDHESAKHAVYAFGEISACSNVKFIRSTTDFDFVDSAKFDELLRATEILKEQGGLLVFLSAAPSTSTKDYGIGAQILKHFGVSQIILISSNKDKEFVGLGGFGLDVIDYI